MTDTSTAADQHVASVTAMYEAFGRGDVPAILEHLDPDVAWDQNIVVEGIPWLRPRQGHAGVQEFFADVAEHLDFEVFEPLAPLANDTQVAWPVRIRAVVRATGEVLEADPELHLFTFRDGKVVDLKHLTDTATQLAAVGG